MSSGVLEVCPSFEETLKRFQHCGDRNSDRPNNSALCVLNKGPAGSEYKSLICRWVPVDPKMLNPNFWFIPKNHGGCVPILPGLNVTLNLIFFLFRFKREAPVYSHELELEAPRHGYGTGWGILGTILTRAGA